MTNSHFLNFFLQEGGFLAEPKTPGQMEFLSELAYTYEETTGVSSWWIGASDSGHEGRWTWGQSGEVIRNMFGSFNIFSILRRCQMNSGPRGVLAEM